MEEIIAMNFFIIEKYSPREMKGVKEQSLLESAVYRPQQSVFGEDAYPTIFEKAAALFESLAKTIVSITQTNEQLLLLLFNFEIQRLSTCDATRWGN